MKFIFTIIGFLFFTHVNAQFDAAWKVRLNNNYNTEEQILFTQDGDTFKGEFSNGDIITGTWNAEKNEISGFLRIDRKLHKFKGFFKNKSKKDMVIAKYCKCSGEPDIPLVFIKQKVPTSSDWRKAEETVRNETVTPEKDYTGRYVITITNLYTNVKGDGPVAIFDETAEMFGSIGIYMTGQSKSGQVSIKPTNGKANRVWSVSESNPVDVKEDGSFYKKLEDVTGLTYTAAGKYEIDKSRSFVIEGELANDGLFVDIQMHLSEESPLGNDVFGWKRRMIQIEDVILNEEYLLKSKELSEGQVAIGFIIEKF